ncbi:MAG: Zn-ribbon domain-containing OB-fold protein [Candidatus Rokubacteria bacterium]|nr:Zn-ribbon domain-containing OB-fold protein [Candidatus Rokubacteria bacterium]
MSEPVVTLKTFFDRAREGRLTGIKCGGCGEVAIPPREFCASCHARAWQVVPLAGDGTLVSYTVIRVAPAKHAADAPYAVGVVKLSEGASIFGRILDVPFEKLAVGMPLRFRPIVADAQTSVGFGPIA